MISTKVLDGLNVEQREAATHADGPLLIIAGPGSGKTHTDAAIMHWCSEVSKAGSEKWGYLRVNQDWWDTHPYRTFEDAVKGVQANQAALGVSNLFFWP